MRQLTRAGAASEMEPSHALLQHGPAHPGASPLLNLGF